MVSRNNRARVERNQNMLEAGLVSAHFPGVASIVISMMYKQTGLAKPIHRVMNFAPGSHAFFKVDCLSSDCVGGGFDMDQIINTMVRNRRETSKGDLACVDSGPRPDHSNIAYEVAIQYA
ncbi:MAG: hypothetical protein AB1499_09915 [Nitrospirota bacterium]